MKPQDDQQSNIDRTVAHAALKKMSRLAADLNAQEQRNRALARRLLIAVGAIALVLGLLLAFTPETLTSLFRAALGTPNR